MRLKCANRSVNKVISFNMALVIKNKEIKHFSLIISKLAKTTYAKMVAQ